MPWFVLALFLPLISLLVLLVAFPRQPIPPPPTADDAVATSAVARALAEAPERSSAHQLVERTGLSERQVLAELRALTNLGRVTRDDSGRFELTTV
jgi:predicted Rossmann fold nucleotide-binding protein DprA/Smf involved in DNA uptake